MILKNMFVSERHRWAVDGLRKRGAWFTVGKCLKKGFVVLTKSFVKIGIAKTFCYNKMFSSINITWVAATKILFVVPNFVAVPKLFFSV